MPCASPRFFSREHIETQRFGASPYLAEQAIHCLELVSELAASGLRFQFKGGNSLLLVLGSPHRFSIDVDIATDESRERLHTVVASLPETYGVFRRWEPRPHKTKPWLPLASYFLYYHSALPSEQESCIMLDVQLRRSPYKTLMAPVACGQLYECSQLVEIPLPASIVGDKLLAIGPQTLGIPFGKGKQAQRIKHVYDVSTLMETEPVLDDIRGSFFACLEHENNIQQKNVSAYEVMLDTVRFCASVTGVDEGPLGRLGNTENALKENTEGIHDFAAHLFQQGYDWQQLQLDMARTAWCITAVCVKHVTQQLFADVTARRVPLPALQNETWRIDGLSEEIWYYWAHTLDLLIPLMAA